MSLIPKRYLLGTLSVQIYDPIDHNLRSKIYSLNKSTIIYDSLSFDEKLEDLYEYRQNHTNEKNYFHDASFYKWQKKKIY